MVYAGHLTKITAYSRYAAITLGDFVQGLVLGCSLVLGSWTGRKLIERMPAAGFSVLAEILLTASGVTLDFGG
jgi:uncharacterized membrane protein YfcA